MTWSTVDFDTALNPITNLILILIPFGGWSSSLYCMIILESPVAGSTGNNYCTVYESFLGASTEQMILDGQFWFHFDSSA